MGASPKPAQGFITRHLFLPVTEEKARTALQDKNEVLALTAYGQASVLLLLFLAEKDSVDLNQAERMLVDLASALAGDNSHEVLSLMKVPAVDVIELAKEKGIRFLSSDEIARKLHLVNGHWNWDLHTIYGQSVVEHNVGNRSLRATSDQIRTLTTLLAEPDEAMEVQGFAGTGKTHLIAHVLHELPGRFTYFAPRARQHQGQVTQFGVAGRPPLTLDVLASEMLREYSWDTGRRIQRHRTEHVSGEAIADQLGICAVGQLRPHEVVFACLSAIQRFCWTDEISVKGEHFNRADRFGLVDLALVREYANKLWQFMTQQPDPRLKMPLREYHIAKFLDLEGRTVPQPYGALLVDEIHDISPTWRRIFARSPNGYVAFGDRYQYIGKASYGELTSGRRRMLEQSVRVGQNSAPMINSILAAHHWRPECEFLGSKVHSTRVRPYPTAPLPPMQEGLVLFAEVWALIEFVQRCAHAEHGNSFKLLPSSREELRRTVSGLTDLYRRNERPSHFSLQDFSTWEAFRLHFQQHVAATRIIHLFEKGFDRTAFERALACETQGRAKLTLALLEDGKNLESDIVILSPDLFQDRGEKFNAATVASIYIATTRAKHELWMPECGQEWLEEHSSSNRRGESLVAQRGQSEHGVG